MATPAYALRLFEDVIRHWRRGGSWSTQWITLRNEADRLEAVVGTLVSSLGEKAFGDAKAHGETLSDDEPSRSPRPSRGASSPTQSRRTPQITRRRGGLHAVRNRGARVGSHYG